MLFIRKLFVLLPTELLSRLHNQFWTTLFSLIVSAVLPVCLTSCEPKQDPAPDAVVVSTKPVDAAKGIVSLFDQYQVVALSELHYNQEIWDIVEAVLDNSRFQSTVQNIALEGGNARYQPLMDRYTNGESVTEAQIKQVWRNNTQVNTTYDAPVYLRMINHVRRINQSRATGQKLRVILLDPAIDWSSIKGETDYFPFLLDREPSMARVIEKEVYVNNQKILFIAGGPHVERNLPTAPVKSALTQLEEKHPKTTFNVAFYSGFGLDQQQLPQVEGLFSGWSKPAIALLEGTPQGELAAGINTAAKGPDGQLIDLYPGLKLKQLFNAIIFAGKRGELSTSSPSLGVCTGKPEDEAWKQELLQRQQLVNVPPPLRTTAEDMCKPLPVRYFDQSIFK
ncbi:hypothetical protein ACFSUS_01450 [Spirosoma soli]|uniref:ChaN family lipoprotein n=1 Tax=Spirosoma soli TaxID=1770529 RepID=A0ABW5LZK2_9BACT